MINRHAFTFTAHVVKDLPWNAAFQINYLQLFTGMTDKLLPYTRLRLWLIMITNKAEEL